MRCLALLLLSCLTLVGEKPTPKRRAPAVPKFTTLPNGMRQADIRPGSGAMPQRGQACSVLYRGWLYVGETKGTMFDQAQDPKEPFVFPVGEGKVIKGWDEAVATMRKGGKRIVILPPELGYGSRGAGGVIPPNATLLFEIELLDIR